MPEWEVLVSLRGSQNHATDTLSQELLRVLFVTDNG
jgi:hypothetical protein